MTEEKTPKQIVELLDKYIIGQNEAKKSVAVALYNRYRRLQLPKQMQQDITPKNMLMAGPTGVGKTEIARRLAKIVDAPFVKVEATKFTEVGYVGRDVESMVRDLVEEAVRMEEKDQFEHVKMQATKKANNRLVKLIVPGIKRENRENSMQPAPRCSPTSAACPVRKRRPSGRSWRSTWRTTSAPCWSWESSQWSMKTTLCPQRRLKPGGRKFWATTTPSPPLWPPCAGRSCWCCSAILTACTTRTPTPAPGPSFCPKWRS